MTFSRFALAAALALGSTSAVAATGRVERLSPPVAQTAELGGDNGLIAVFAALAGIVAFFVLTDGGSDAPVSP